MNGCAKALLTTLALTAGVVALAGEELPVASAESMDALMSAWVRAYTAAHPASPARVARRARFSADLLDALARGEVQVAPFARELFPSEQARFRELTGEGPVLVPVATGSRATKGGTHAIVIFVNVRNPIARLSLAQLREVFAADGAITTWGQLGLTGEWADRRIQLHGMRGRRESGNPPGIVNYLESRLLAGRRWRPDLHEYADQPGVQSLEQIVRAVAADPAGLGYSGFAYAVPGAKPVALAETEAGPWYAGTSEDIAQRRYPLTRTVYLATGARPTREAREFVALARSAAGQRAIAGDRSGFFPLPVGPAPGTSYLTSDGAVAIVGYNDMAEMLDAVTRRFEEIYPGVRFALRLEGTRTAPPALARGESALAPMGAEFSPAELAAYRAAGHGEPRMFRIAHASLRTTALSGPLAIFVPRDSPIRHLSLADLAEIFSGQSTRGLQPYGLAPATALGRFMQARGLGGADLGPQVRVFAQSRDVVRAVAADPRGIGFAAAVAAQPGVRALPLAERPGDPPVELTEATVQAGLYPLDRFLLIYARDPLDPLVRAYLDLVLSPEGQGLIGAGKLGYLPLNAVELATERTKLGPEPVGDP